MEYYSKRSRKGSSYTMGWGMGNCLVFVKRQASRNSTVSDSCFGVGIARLIGKEKDVKERAAE